MVAICSSRSLCQGEDSETKPCDYWRRLVWCYCSSSDAMRGGSRQGLFRRLQRWRFTTFPQKASPALKRPLTQALADQSHLTTFGLPTRRDPGGIAEGPSAHLRVRFHAGWQTLSRAFWLSEAPECIDVFESVSAVAAASGAAATPSRWVECYDQSFDSISGGARWLWDYQAGYLGDPDDEPSDAAESR